MLGPSGRHAGRGIWIGWPRVLRYEHTFENADGFAMMPDTYISGDIEADGPIPGQYSMLAFGLVVASTFDGVQFRPRDLQTATFYRELKPVSDRFDSDALAVSGLDRRRLAVEGSEPAAAMHDAADWVLTQAAGTRPVLVGYPIVFDWLFLHWYFVRFVGESPFGFSGALDIKTMYQQKSGVTLDAAGRTDLPDELIGTRAHTHNALDDAVEQAEIFNRLFVWSGPE